MRGTWSLLLLCVACAGAPAPGRTVSAATYVAVTIEPTPRELPFNPRGAQLAAAFQQLGELAGHPIGLTLDAAVSPESRSSFEFALIDAFESIARDLDDLRRNNHPAYEFGVARLNRVELRYDATQARDLAQLDEVTHSLVIRGPAVRSALVARGVVRHVLLEVYDRSLKQRFAGQAPEAIVPSERSAYFRWLTRNEQASRDESTVDGLANSHGAALTLRVLQLFSQLDGTDATLATEMRNWLLHREGFFSQHYLHRGKLVTALPANSLFDRAARAWTAWALRIGPSLDDASRLALARALFLRSFQDDRAITHRSYPPFAWPGADLFAFGLHEVDRWRAAGHPTQRSTPRSSAAMEFIVCSRPVEPDGTQTLAPNCNEDWYRYAFETNEGRRRLTDAITVRADPVFTETVFRNVGATTSQPIDLFLVLLRALENSTPSWKIGWRVLSENYVDGVFDRAVLDESRRLWVTRPELRGVLLSGLAHMDRYRQGSVDWAGFAAAFGSPIRAVEFADYVATDPLALSNAAIVWPALERGWSRAAIVVPKLDSWLVSARVRAYDFQDPYQALQRLIGEMCREKGTQDLAAMRNYLTARRQSHPGEPYPGLIDQTQAEECQPPPPPPPPRNEVKLSPLKHGLPPLRIIQTGAE